MNNTFYLFQISYTTEISSDGRIIKKFSWKYPLAISLIVWIFWHFYLYPPAEEMPILSSTSQEYNTSGSVIPLNNITKTNKLMAQRINMVNWN